MVCVHVLLATLVLTVVSVLQGTSEQLMELVNVWKAIKKEFIKLDTSLPQKCAFNYCECFCSCITV